MTAAIWGIGTAVPRLRLDSREALDAARAICAEEEGHAELLASLYRQAGVRVRHVSYTDEEFRCAVYGEGECDSPFIPRHKGDRGPSTAKRMVRYEVDATPLAERASRLALERSGVAHSEITHLVTVSCTGFAAPGVDIALIKNLGLRATVERSHIGFMGCHGALNGLRVARGLLAAESNARVLLCSVELCSLHYSYGWDPKKMVGNALFADGSAAVVLGPQPPNGDDPWCVKSSGACLFPDSEHAMAWRIRDHGFDMILSTRVPGLIQQNLRPWLEAWLDQNRLAITDVASWAIHPGGPRVLSCVEEAIGLSRSASDVSRTILETHGNMSSATVLFIIEELIRQRAARPCVALGFGPGLAAEATLFV